VSRELLIGGPSVNEMMPHAARPRLERRPNAGANLVLAQEAGAVARPYLATPGRDMTACCLFVKEIGFVDLIVSRGRLIVKEIGFVDLLLFREVV